jgi:hypothetical protein
MTEEVCFPGEVDYDETHVYGGKMGFWLGRKSDNLLKRILDRITPSAFRFREYQTSLPMKESEVEDWESGDRVLIQVKNIDRSEEEIEYE